MVDDILFHAPLLVVLLWLCLTWDSLAARSRLAPYPGQRQPTKPTKTRFQETKPFSGFTAKPLCVACEQRPEQGVALRPAAPPRLPSSGGRPRHVATPRHFCPEPLCCYDGWVGRGNIRANGHRRGGPWRQLQCVVCHRYFLETHGTVFHRKRVPAERIRRVVAALAEGLGIRAVARVFEVDPNTVLTWLIAAANHLKAFSQFLLQDLQLTQVQLAELFAVLSEVEAGHVSGEAAIERLERSPYWVWAGIDPVSKLLVAIDIGEHTLAIAQCLVHQVVQVLAPGCVPLFLTDGLKEYVTALLTHFRHWVQPPRQQAKGPTPKPRWIPLPALLYVQVVKTYQCRRPIHVSHRVVFGTLAGVTQVLAPLGWHMNTAFIERVNLTIRQHGAAVSRRVITLCKNEGGLRHQRHLYQTYHNFCLPHGSLRVPLAQPQPTKGSGSAKRWRLRTPAMATGLTDRVWSLREVLLFRVPPWPQPQAL